MFFWCAKVALFTWKPPDGLVLVDLRPAMRGFCLLPAGRGNGMPRDSCKGWINSGYSSGKLRHKMNWNQHININMKVVFRVFGAFRCGFEGSSTFNGKATKIWPSRSPQPNRTPSSCYAYQNSWCLWMSIPQIWYLNVSNRFWSRLSMV